MPEVWRAVPETSQVRAEAYSQRATNALVPVFANNSLPGASSLSVHAPERVARPGQAKAGRRSIERSSSDHDPSKAHRANTSLTVTLYSHRTTNEHLASE